MGTQGFRTPVLKQPWQGAIVTPSPGPQVVPLACECCRSTSHVLGLQELGTQAPETDETGLQEESVSK